MIGKHTKEAMERLGITDLSKVPPEHWQEIDEARRRDHEDEEMRIRKATRQVEFDRTCPPIFQDTDQSRLPANAERVVRWGYSPRGMVINGTTGRGKTRAMWCFVRRVFVEEGHSFQWYDALRFSDEAVGSSRDSALDAFVGRLARVPVMVLDDLGKAKITPKVTEALFALIDRRTAAKRPTYITTNCTAETLLQRFEDQETAIPLLRRISEFFETITL